MRLCDAWSRVLLSVRNYDFSSIRVLIVDRNAFMRRVLRSILRTFSVGAILDERHMETAWDTLQSTQPDMVFLDWSPSFNGLAMLKRIRNDKGSMNLFVPVIITSSLTEPDSVIEARDAGMTTFIARPFSPKLVYDRMCTVIEYPRAYVRSDDFFGPDRRHRNIAVENDRRKGDPEAEDKK